MADELMFNSILMGIVAGIVATVIMTIYQLPFYRLWG